MSKMTAKLIRFIPKSELDRWEETAEKVRPLVEAVKDIEDACPHRWGEWEVDPMASEGWSLEEEDDGFSPVDFRGCDALEAQEAHDLMKYYMGTAMVRWCDRCGKMEERPPNSQFERDKILEAFQEVLFHWNPVFKKFCLPTLGISNIA